MFVYKDGFIIINNFSLWNNELNKFIDNISAKIPCDKEKMKGWFNGNGMDFFVNGQLAFYKDLEQRIPYPVMNQNVLIMQKRCGFDALYNQFLIEFNLSENKQLIASHFKVFRKDCYSQQGYQDFNKMETAVISAHNAYRKSRGSLTMEESLNFVQQQINEYPNSIRHAENLQLIEIEEASTTLIGFFKPKAIVSLKPVNLSISP